MLRAWSPSLRRYCRLLVVIASSTVLRGMPAAAQTRFLVPDTTVNVARLPSADACAAEVQRIRQVIETHEALTANPDTMPWDAQARFRPLPAPVVEAAQRCDTRFGGDTAPLANFAPLFALALAANRDAEASALLQRRLHAVDAKRQDAERAAVIDSAVGMYVDAQPVRLEPAESLLLARLGRKTDRLARLKVYFEVARQAAVVRDTTRLRRLARTLVAIGDSLTPSERESQEFEAWLGPQRLLIAMSWALGDKPFLDNLRSGTAAYASFMRMVWAKSMQARPEAMPTPNGEKAPSITADYWFPRDSVPAAGAPPTRPVPGRVNLVVFLDHVVCVESVNSWLDDDKHSDACWGLAANLRRLATRFPALAITLVGGTHGYFMAAPPMPPAEEAALTARFAAAHRFPGVLAISASKFSSIDSPDDRRIDKPDSNVVRYEFGKSQMASGSAYLIDQDGLIVDLIRPGSLSGPDLELLMQKVDVVMDRQAGGASRAAR
jgi:hypothetical protein